MVKPAPAIVCSVHLRRPARGVQRAGCTSRLGRLSATGHPARVVREKLSAPALRVLSVMAGGAAGALLRAAAGRAFPHAKDTWPWATFAVNIAGALLLAWVTTRLTEIVAPSRYWRLLVGTGFCGALTTFSTFQVETIQIARAGRVGLAAGYAAVSIVAGMAAAILGTVGARWRRYG
jgi:fluoride exporter